MRKKLKRTLKLTRIVIYAETLIDSEEHFWTFIGAFVGIGLIGFIQTFYLSVSDNSFLVGSFGASAVLIYGVINSPLAQPRNLIGGHILSAVVGVTVNYLGPCSMGRCCPGGFNCHRFDAGDKNAPPTWWSHSTYSGYRF